MMSATNDFFMERIAQIVNQGLAIPVLEVTIEGALVKIVAKIEGEAADTAFWRAVLEQKKAE